MSGKWYGCVQNRLQAQSRMPVPVVGMGVTELLWSDRHPFEVIEVKDEKHCTIRAMKHTRTDDCGISEHQEYKYESDPEGEVKKLVFRNGAWHSYKTMERIVRDKGGNPVKDADGYAKYETVTTRSFESSQWFLGKAEEYRDPSF